MTNEPNLHELSRRKVLAAFEAVGIASTGAGLRSTVFFIDSEAFDLSFYVEQCQ